MLWADTTAGIMKMRNGANSAWISLWELDGTFIATDISLSAGTAGAPSLYFTGDTNTGVYSPGADQVAISAGGTARLTTTTTGITSALAVDVPLGAVGTPSITFTGDTNTGIYSPGADQIAITTGGTGRLFIDSSGRLLAGSSTARSNFFGTTLSSLTQIEGTGGSTARGSLSVLNNDVSNNPPYVLLGRSGAATLGSNAAVVSGSRLGTLTFHGADGASFIEAATVAGEVDGTPGSNDMPGRLVFSTTSDGAASPTERFRIGNAGQLGIGGATYGTSGQVLTSGGASAAPTWSAAPSPAALTTASGSAPSYSARAWVNFDGTANTNLTGTYSQSGTTVTVTATAHGLIAGNAVFADITSGTGVDGDYTVATVTNANTFTYTAGTSLTTSGNITIRRNTIRGSGNVSSISDNGIGDYTVNFTTAMPDANYSAVTGTRRDSGTLANWAVLPTTYSTSSLVVNVMPGGSNALVDSTFVNVVIFR